MAFPATKDRRLKVRDNFKGGKSLPVKHTGQLEMPRAIGFSREGNRFLVSDGAVATSDRRPRLFEVREGKIYELGIISKVDDRHVIDEEGAFNALFSSSKYEAAKFLHSTNSLMLMRKEVTHESYFDSDSGRAEFSDQPEIGTVFELWDLDSGRLSRSARLRFRCTDFSISSDDNLLAIASGGGLSGAGGPILVVEAQTMKPLYSLHGHQGSIRSLAFAPPGPDSYRLVASSGDGTVREWLMSKSSSLNSNAP